MRWWCIGAALMPLLLVQLLLHMYNVLHICTSLSLVLSLLCMLLYLLFVFTALHTLECPLPFHGNPRAPVLHYTYLSKLVYQPLSKIKYNVQSISGTINIIICTNIDKILFDFLRIWAGTFLFPMHLDRPLRCHCWSFIPSAFWLHCFFKAKDCLSACFPLAFNCAGTIFPAHASRSTFRCHCSSSIYSPTCSACSAAAPQINYSGHAFSYNTLQDL